MTDDPFPRARFDSLVGRLPAYVRLAWQLVKDPALSKTRRAALLAVAGYLVSPLDALNGTIPVLGALEDVAVAIAAIRLALGGLSPEQRRKHLAEVGLEDANLVEDLKTTGAITVWIARRGVRLGARAARQGAKAAATGGRAAAAGAGMAASGAKTITAASRDRVIFVAGASASAIDRARDAVGDRLSARRAAEAMPAEPPTTARSGPRLPTFRRGRKTPETLEVEADVLLPPDGPTA